MVVFIMPPVPIVSAQTNAFLMSRDMLARCLAPSGLLMVGDAKGQLIDTLTVCPYRAIYSWFSIPMFYWLPTFEIDARWMREATAPPVVPVHVNTRTSRWLGQYIFTRRCTVYLYKTLGCISLQDVVQYIFTRFTGQYIFTSWWSVYLYKALHNISFQDFRMYIFTRPWHVYLYKNLNSKSLQDFGQYTFISPWPVYLYKIFDSIALRDVGHYIFTRRWTVYLQKNLVSL